MTNQSITPLPAPVPDGPAASRSPRATRVHALIPRVRSTPGIAAFVVVLVITLMFSFHVGDVAFPAEAADLAGREGVFRAIDGSFAFSAWPSTRHGYVYPLLNAGARELAAVVGIPAWAIVKLGLAALLSGLATLILPWFVAVASGRSLGFGQRLMIGALLLVFWRGHALYPSPQLFGTSLLLIGSALAIRGLRALPARPRLDAAIVGASLAGAAITMPSATPAALMALVAMLVAIAKRRTYQHPIVPTTWLAAGLVAVMAPQISANHERGLPLNPVRPSTAGVPEAQVALLDGLSTRELVASLDSPEQPTAVPARHKPASDVKQPGEAGFYESYMSHAMGDPVGVALSTAMHLVAGLDLGYNTPYPVTPARSTFLRVANAAILLAAVLLLGLAARAGRARTSSRGLVFGVIVLALPVLTVLGAPARDANFLPAYLFAYVVVACGFSSAWHRRRTSPNHARAAEAAQARHLDERTARSGAGAHGFEARVLIPLVALALVGIVVARILIPLMSTSSGGPQGDDVWPLTRFIAPAIMGEYDWSHLLVDSFNNGQQQALSFLVYYAGAVLTDLDYRSFVWYAAALGLVRTFLLYDLVVRASRRIAGRQLLLVGFAALTFGFGQYSIFEFDVTSVPFGTSMTALVIGAWAIVRFAPRWPGALIAALSGLLGCFASGMGPMAWPVLIGLFVAFGYRSRRMWAVLLASFSACAATYLYFAMTSDSVLQGRAAGSWVNLWLLRDLLGLPFAAAGSADAQRAGWVSLAAIVTAAVVVVWSLRTRSASFRSLAPGIAFLLFGLLTLAQLYALRGLSVQYYAYASLHVWIGLMALAYVVLAASPWRSARSSSRRGRIAANAVATWPVLVVIASVGMYLPGNRTWEDKTMFSHLRSEASEACIRHYRVAPRTCEVDMVPWGVGSKPQFLRELGEPLERAHLGPFAPSQRWSLQGEFQLDTVRTDERVADVIWTRNRDYAQVSFHSIHHLDLLVVAPNVAEWTVELPPKVDATLRTAIGRTRTPTPTGTHPDIAGTVEVTVDGSLVQSKHVEIDADDHAWKDASMRLDRFAGHVVTIRFRAESTPDNENAVALFRHPVIDVSNHPGTTSSLDLEDPWPHARAVDLALPVDDADAWKTDNVDLLDERFEGHPMWSAPGIGPQQTRWAPLPELRPTLTLRRPLDECLGDFSHFAFTMAATPPWLADNHDLVHINHGMRIMFTIDDEQEFTDAHSVVVPFDLRGAADLDERNEPILRMRRYSYPIRALELPRTARLTGIALAPFDMGLHGIDNHASFGEFRLVRRSSRGSTSCDPVDPGVPADAPG